MAYSTLCHQPVACACAHAVILAYLYVVLCYVCMFVYKAHRETMCDVNSLHPGPAYKIYTEGFALLCFHSLIGVLGHILLFTHMTYQIVRPYFQLYNNKT